MILQKLKTFFESKLSVAILFALFFVFNILDLFYINLILASLFILFTFVFCDDVTNFFAPILVISFLIKPVGFKEYYLWYFICALVVLIAFVAFIIKRIIKKDCSIKKGKMFWPLMICFFAFLIGGIIGHFKAINSLYVLGICFVLYVCYFIAVNFCKNLKDKMFFILLLSGILIYLCFVVSCIKTGDFISAVLFRYVTVVGAQNINVASLFILLGMVASFYMAEKFKKFDYLFYALAVVMCASVVTTFCRGSIFIAIIAFLALTIILFIKSKHKWQLGIITIAVVAILGISILAGNNLINGVIDTLITKIKTGSDGREELWPWCFNKFKQNWAFGIGFISEEPVPTVASNMVLAHNTILQWLTSLGVFGSLLISVFYYGKYKQLFKGVNKNRFFVVFLILVIAVSGVFDQAAAMDIFTNIVVLIMLATVEEENQQPSVAEKIDAVDSVLESEQKIVDAKETKNDATEKKKQI